MSLTTTLVETLASIDEALSTATAEVTQLEAAREAVVALMDNEDRPVKTIKVTDKPMKKKAPVNASTTATTQRDRIEEMLRAGKTPKWIAEKIGHSTPSYVYKVKSEMQPDIKITRVTGDSKKSATTQREKIKALLAKGQSPKAIAEKLNTHVSYVYTVKNS